MALTDQVDKAMPERYDVSYLLEQAKQLQPVRAQLEAITYSGALCNFF
jgi:hypothetical protein